MDSTRKSQEFLFIIQGMILTSFARSGGKLPSMASYLSIAHSASERLPNDRDALLCALDFAQAALPEFATGRQLAGYRLPDWTGLSDDWINSPTEERIDGKWQPENPRWAGLPSDRSDHLELMALLRDGGRKTVFELNKATGHSHAKIRARLRAMERLGTVTCLDVEKQCWTLADLKSLPD
ncbi:hypothetical protein [Rhizobium sp. NFR03]|uniref:hypothetical protein n=1 Tax=Rhizobium sp. NFR03 TaxID=1566263 RepID=UPI0008C2183A|nr:hypothetical protein [Rhizobium sp. NFR03]SES44313.1 hypothetical protein SAMN03159406_04507 [Rhizobium sp. NFR03]